jgi:hypothetical protein
MKSRIDNGLSRALDLLSVRKAGSDRLTSNSTAHIRVLAALCLLACSNAVWALSTSVTSAPTGNYTVSWAFPMGCTEYDAWGNPMTMCYQVEEQNDGEGQYGGDGWVVAATSGTSITYTNRALGNYQYRIHAYWYGYYGSGDNFFFEGPISLSVGNPNGPQPGLFVNSWAVGPISDPIYYMVSWNAMFGASANSCKIYKLKKVLFWFEWDRISGWFPTSGTLNIGSPKGVKVKCTGPGGSSTIEHTF